jgi:hypothetical protein
MAGLDPAIHEPKKAGSDPGLFSSSLRGALATKQSILLLVATKLDCFASLAMTLRGRQSYCAASSASPSAG